MAVLRRRLDLRDGDDTVTAPPRQPGQPRLPDPPQQSSPTPVPLEQTLSPGFSQQVRSGTSPDALATWDPNLPRPPRVLVPIDVQALVVPPGDQTAYVEVLPPLPDPAPQPPADGTPPTLPAPVPPFEPGQQRAVGVYLHWAAPDALTRAGERTPGADGSPGVDPGLPPLADRYLVVRLGGGIPRRTRAWVIEAERGRSTDLSAWSPDGPPPDQPGRTPHLSAGRLTATCGGDPAWAAVYDAVEDRFALYDPLDDLTPEDAGGPLSYLVCGWWSDPANDPLAVELDRTARLADLQWSVPAVPPDLQTTRMLFVAQGGAVGTPTPSIAEPATPDPSLTAAASQVIAAESPGVGQTLLHGSVLGVNPLQGQAVPAADGVQAAVGGSATEAFAAIVAAGQPVDQRAADERLVAAFSAGLLDRLDAPDGLVTLDEAEHAGEFTTAPGGVARTDRVVDADRVRAITDAARAAPDVSTAPPVPPPPDVSTAPPVPPPDVSTAPPVPPAPAAPASPAASAPTPTPTAAAVGQQDGLLIVRSPADVLTALREQTATTPAPLAGGPPLAPGTVPIPPAVTPPTPGVRDVDVAADPWRVPGEQVVTLQGLQRSLRHGNDGRFAADGTVACRVSGQVPTSYAGVVDGYELVLPLPHGGLPPECDDLLRELVLDDVSRIDEVSQYIAGRLALDPAAVRDRLGAEWLLLQPWMFTPFTPWPQLLAPSIRDGMLASPLARTTWGPAWVPLYLEWEATLVVDDRLDTWSLGEVDFDVAASGAAPPVDATPTVVRGRTLMTSVAARQFAAQVQAFVAAEDQRPDDAKVLRADEDQALAAVGAAGDQLDLLSAALNGIREQLLGLDPAAVGRTTARADGTNALPTPVRPPLLIRAGSTAVSRLRVVDAFGQTLELPPERLVVAQRLQPASPATGDAPPSTLLRPRLTRPARFDLSFVDPATPDGVEPGPAVVDQNDPTGTVSPVCGWLLADHLDGSLEVYDAAAEPLGMLLEDVDGRVVWEGAPGQPGPAGAPPAPLRPDDSGARHIVRLAAGMVAADSRQRADAAAHPAADGEAAESALAALLRCVDTTLWSVDPFGSTGTEYVAGLVGRPLAVARMTLRLSVRDDLGSGPDAELELDDAAHAIRRAAYDTFAARQIAVRLGELTRADDGVLGYFVDDDYACFTPVSPEVLAAARAGGRQVGQLSVLGATSAAAPDVEPVRHPYVDDTEQPLAVRPGQLVRLTVLMVPGGAVHATSGVLPRVAVQMAREWVSGPLQQLSPSFRIGPVLVDPSTVQLPKTSGLPQDQAFTSRIDPQAWRDDPIAAATQTALLPDVAPMLREGYVRVAKTD